MMMTVRMMILNWAQETSANVDVPFSEDGLGKAGCTAGCTDVALKTTVGETVDALKIGVVGISLGAGVYSTFEKRQ